MMEQIDRDVLRTHPDMHFFSGDDGSAVTHRAVPPPAAARSLLSRECSAFTHVHIKKAVCQ